MAGQHALVSLLLTLFTLVPVTPATERYPKNFVFLVDISGSMAGPELARAVSAFLEIAQQPIDDGSFTIYTFCDTVGEWPEGWQKMPSADAVKKANTYLSSLKGNGDTFVVPAFKEALALDKKELSVVVITDGRFGSPDGHILKELEAYQKARVKRKLPRAVIGAIGVSKWATGDSLAAIAEAGGGGYYKFTEGK